jgi:hypothetical protein
MKKAILAIIVLGLCFGLATTDMAQGATGTTTVTVTVNEIDTLTVPATVAITLETVDGTTPTKYAQGTATDTNGLTYSHNSTTNKKITATAVADTGNADNDITLAVAIGTQTAQEVVTAGTVQADVELWTNIAADSYTQDLTWTADATIAGTPASTTGYAFTVTFTTADVL